MTWGIRLCGWWRLIDFTMHIGFHYTSALRQQGGIGRYTRELINTLAILDTKNRYTLLVSKDSPLDKLPTLPDNFQVKVMPLTEKIMTILWHRLYLPLWVDVGGGAYDIFHSPNFILPPLYNTCGLLTVHDLSFMKYPHKTVPKLQKWLSKTVPHSIKRATHVLADSMSTKNDLETMLNVPSKKISVVGAGVESRFKPIIDTHILNHVRQKYNLPTKFILGLSTLEPRKNFEGLIQAFNHVEPFFSDMHLVIAGGKGWLYESIFAEAESSSVSDKIHIIGFVDDDDLPAIYSMAEVFAYPSYYEGFGIPVLESMACGTPVVAADNSSLPEVMGEAGIMVPATDITALAVAIKELCCDHALRERYIQRGFEQASKFTWGKTADILLNVYSMISTVKQ